MKPLMAGFSFFVLAIELKIIRIFFNYINCWKEKKKNSRSQGLLGPFCYCLFIRLIFKKILLVFIISNLVQLT